MAPNWPCIEKITMTSQFADMTFYIFTAFTVFELLRKTQQKGRRGGGVKLPSTQIRVTLFIANPFKHDTHFNTEANTFLIVFCSESSIIPLNFFS